MTIASAAGSTPAAAVNDRATRRALRQTRGDQSLDQGDFGESWVRLLAAAAGLDCAERRVERVADFTLTYPKTVYWMGRSLREFDIKAQVKTAADATHDGHGHILYDLDVDTFNILSGTLQTPTYLFVVTVESDRRLWVRQVGHSDKLSWGAYWVSLAGRRTSSNSATQRVKVPLANRLSPDALRALCVEQAKVFLERLGP